MVILIGIGLHLRYSLCSMYILTLLILPTEEQSIHFHFFLWFSCSVFPNTLWPHGLQHARFPCPLPTPRACWNSYPSSQWCHQTTSSCYVPFSSCLQSFPASMFFSNESVLCSRWPKCWSFSFSISPSKEYSGLISFRIDWWSCYHFLNCFGFIFCR